MGQFFRGAAAHIYKLTSSGKWDYKQASVIWIWRSFWIVEIWIKLWFLWCNIFRNVAMYGSVFWQGTLKYINTLLFDVSFWLSSVGVIAASELVVDLMMHNKMGENLFLTSWNILYSEIDLITLHSYHPQNDIVTFLLTTIGISDLKRSWSRHLPVILNIFWG